MEKRLCEQLTSSLNDALTEHITIIVEEKVIEHLAPMWTKYIGGIIELTLQGSEPSPGLNTNIRTFYNICPNIIITKR